MLSAIAIFAAKLGVGGCTPHTHAPSPVLEDDQLLVNGGFDRAANAMIGRPSWVSVLPVNNAR